MWGFLARVIGRKQPTPIECPEPITNESYGWHHVDDKMPQTSHDDIVVWNGRWSRAARCLGSIYDRGLYFYTHDDVKLKGITHWHHLEPPPEKLS